MAAAKKIRYMIKANKEEIRNLSLKSQELQLVKEIVPKSEGNLSFEEELEDFNLYLKELIDFNNRLKILAQEAATDLKDVSTRALSQALIEEYKKDTSAKLKELEELESKAQGLAQGSFFGIKKMEDDLNRAIEKLDKSKDKFRSAKILLKRVKRYSKTNISKIRKLRGLNKEIQNHL